MDQVQKLLTKLYRQVGTTRAKRYCNLVATGEWGLLQKESIAPIHTYHSSEAYRRDALIVDITRKLLLPGDNDKRAQAAREKFFLSEKQCAETNARLDRYIREQGPFEASDCDVIAFIRLWRKNLARALGNAPFVLTPRFSPGATLSHAGKLITIPDKMARCSSTYLHSEAFVRPYFLGTLISENPPSLEAGNRFFTVPKDSATDRGCCVEASLNVMLQLDVGRRMKAKYAKRYQVDLREAEPIHRELAKLGSERGHLATIDLSNASDTVSRKLVQLLLPCDWWELLNTLRAHKTSLDGTIYYLEKFSSMGNGFTFELETFIFRTLCETIGCEVAYCFGDDIIVDTPSARAVLAALRFFGFTPNVKKTFCEGPFRESCGGDFFLGQTVRSYFMKELPDEPQKWIRVANGLRRADPTMKYVGSAWRYAVSQVPIDLRCYGPEALGDAVIFDPDATPKVRRVKVGCSRERRFEYLPTWAVVVPVTRKLSLTKYWEPDIALSAASYGTGPDIAFRGNVVGWRRDVILAFGLLDPQAAMLKLAHR